MMASCRAPCSSVGSHATPFTTARPRLQRTLQRHFVPQASLSAATTSLTDWAASQGVDVGKLGVQITSSGLIASKPVAKGETIASIPEGAWITKDTVHQSVLGPFVQSLEPWVAVALLLVLERGNAASPWRPYLDSMPSEVASPVAWTEEELQMLQGTQLLTAVQGYRAFFGQRYQQLQQDLFAPNPQIFPPEVFTYDAFLWASCTVRSRAHAPLDGENIALVPIADSVQHGRGALANVSWELKSAGLFGRGRTLAVEASRALQPQEPVVMDYAPGRTEGQLLLDFGVLDGPAAAGTFALTITLPAEDRFFDDKVDILEQAGMQDSMEFVLSVGSPAPDGMLGMLRLINLQATDAFLLESIFRNEVWEHMQLPVSEENERAIYASMVDGCAAALAAYPTTMDEDMAALGAAAPGSRAAAAAAVRLGEKEALAAALQFFEGRMEKLSQFEYYADRRLKRLGLLDKEGKPTDWESFFEDGIA